MVAQQIETSAAIEQHLDHRGNVVLADLGKRVVESQAIALNNATTVLDLSTLTQLINTALGDRTANVTAGLLPLLGGSAGRDAYSATHHG